VEKSIIATTSSAFLGILWYNITMKLETKNTKSFESVYERLEELSPDCRGYLQLYVEMLSEIETPFYQENPGEIIHCFPTGLDDDINEIISYFKNLGDSPESAISILQDLKEVLKQLHPVTYTTLQPLFEYFNLTEGEGENADNDENLRFRVPNLFFSKRESDAFLSACGLSPLLDEGSGSHTKWVDEYGQFMTISSLNGKKWIKHDIKDLLKNRYPIERIQEACRKLKIQFEIL